MAKAKTQPNKAEHKAIAIALNEHKNLIESIEWDGEGDQFFFTVTLADGATYEDTDIHAAIAEALEHAQAEMPEAVEEEAAEDEAEEAKVGKTIVPVRYRHEYKARGDARGCGDWLMLKMRELLNAGSKKAPVNLPLTYELARANGVTKEWPGLNPGQQRMNAGNGIRRAVRKAGHLVVPASMSATKEELKLDAMDWVREQEAAEQAKAATKAA